MRWQLWPARTLTPLASIEIRHLGGALARPATGGGAQPSIDASYVMHAAGFTPTPELAAAVRGHAQAVKDALGSQAFSWEATKKIFDPSGTFCSQLLDSAASSPFPYMHAAAEATACHQGCCAESRRRVCRTGVRARVRTASTRYSTATLSCVTPASPAR